MTPEDIAKLRGLLERATSGPWSFRGAIPASGTFTIDDGTGLGIVALHVDHGDAALICAAVNSLPALLDEHERAMAVVRKVAKMDAVVNLGGVYDASYTCVTCDGDEDFSCGGEGFEHAPDCAWVAARGMVG
jgi:hypothetical protein